MVDRTRLAGRVVAITGGGSGIGRGAAVRCADEGAKVAVLDVRSHLAEAVADEIRVAGGEALAVECNVADEASVEAAIALSVAHFGSLWGMVANAGTASRGWIHETALADWNFVMNVNLTGAFLCAKHAIPHMLEGGGGSFVGTASIAGSVIGPGGANASYAVSKAGLMQLARQIAVDYGRQGIRANAIQPAAVDGSNLGRHAAEDRERQSTPNADLPRPRGWQPIARAGRPYEDYGAAIAFLLSDDAAFITGSSVPVEGGFLST